MVLHKDQLSKFVELDNYTEYLTLGISETKLREWCTLFGQLKYKECLPIYKTHFETLDEIQKNNPHSDILYGIFGSRMLDKSWTREIIEEELHAYYISGLSHYKDEKAFASSFSYMAETIRIMVTDAYTLFDKTGL